MPLVIVAEGSRVVNSAYTNGHLQPWCGRAQRVAAAASVGAAVTHSVLRMFRCSNFRDSSGRGHRSVGGLVLGYVAVKTGDYVADAAYTATYGENAA